MILRVKCFIRVMSWKHGLGHKVVVMIVVRRPLLMVHVLPGTLKGATGFTARFNGV